MTAFETFAASWADAISILDGAFGATAGDLVEAGLDSRMARKVVRLAGVYFGPTHAGKKQAQACRSARENRHTFNTLGEIETFVGRLKNKAHAWAMRKALCKEPANLKRINERGKELLSEFNGPEQPANKASLRATAIPDSTYMHFRACAPGHLVKAAMDALTEHASEEHPAERAMKILAGGGNPAGPAVVPAVIISIDDAGALITAEGDEVILSLTNGTRMLGADFIRNALADYGYAMLVDPVRGPINVYRTSRFATKKQRLMASLENPVCSWPGCGVGAEYCQINHNQAWSAGGETNIDNLATVCRFHNGRNDDDRGSPRYGYLDRIDGHVQHVPPFRGPPKKNSHPVAQGGAMRIV